MRGEKYVGKPCPHGHALRYVATDACVECTSRHNKATHERYQQDSELREKRRAKNRDWYARNRERSKEYRLRPENKEKHRDREHVRKLRERGLSPEDYDLLLVAQGGVCAVCGIAPQGRRLAVDHDHDTGEVRGLLCNGCNRAIGWTNDDPGVLRRAAGYLECPTAPAVLALCAA